ncbi:MAG: hypothetical protein ISR90_01065 [Candidatus Marinimicrobia bacterium]|nr:hypothetical protein [Candidatus Neomarinimicrobiota bacterium]MBL7022634.1 hypothetical protein [Candidatus Neomarinimicrobiota bacterium]
MKIIIHFILLLSLGFTQTSSLSLYGFGELQQSFDPSSIGIGDSKYFSTRSDGVSLSSPSSQWKSAFTRLNISTSFSWNASDSIAIQFGNSVDYLSFSVPAGRNKVLNIGFKPYTRNKYYITETMLSNPSISYGDETLRYFSHYKVNGGISDLFMSYSSSISDKFSFGLQWNVGFGTQERTDSTFTYKTIIDYDENIEYQLIDTDIIRTLDRFRSNTINFEGRFSLSRNEIVFGIEYFNPVTIVSNRVNDITIAPETHFKTKGKLSSFGFGYSFQPTSDLGLVLEIHQKESISVPYEIANFHKQFADLQRNMNFGIYKQFNNKAHGRWNSIGISSGGFVKQFIHDDKNFYDFGFSLGTILEWGKTQNLISVGLKIGFRSSEFAEFDGEKYIKLTVGISAGETWFIKRKRK